MLKDAEWDGKGYAHQCLYYITSKNEACMNWSNHKNVHGMRLHHVHHTCMHAGQLGKPCPDAMIRLMTQQKAIKLEPKTVK